MNVSLLESDPIYDLLLEGVQILDDDLRYVYVNETHAAYQNLDKRSLIGRKLTDRFPTIVNHEIFDHLMKCKTQRVIEYTETEFIYPDKTRRFFELTIKPIAEGLLILSIDITAKKTAEIEKDRLSHLAIASEQRLKHALDTMFEGAQILDFNWRYLYINDAAVKSSQYSREDLIGFTMMERYPGVENTSLYHKINQCMVERAGASFETQFTFPDASIGIFDISVQPIPEGVFILSVDTTKQHNSEKKLAQANRLYAFLSAINQAIVHLQTLPSLLDRACAAAVETGGFKFAMVIFFDEVTLSPRITNILGDDEAVRQARAFIGSGRSIHEFETSLMVRSLRSGQYAVSNNVQTDPTMEAWQPGLTHTKFESVISLPIRSFGKVVGVFVLTSHTTSFFDAPEIAVLEEATNDISFAIDNFKQAEQYKETQDLVVERERRFRALIEHSADMKTLATREGLLLYVSPSVTKFLGYTQEDLISTSLFDLIHPDDIELFLRKREQILDRRGASFSFQQRRRHKGGGWLWCEGTLTNMLAEPGVKAMVTNFRDISDKKISEQLREFDRNNLDALINNTLDLMWSIDRDYNLITSNQPFNDRLRSIGYAIEKGESIFKGAKSALQSFRFKALYDRVFADETFTETEHQASPTEQWLEISYAPIRKGKDIIGAACHSRDITTARTIARRLEKSEAFNRGVLNSLNSRIAVVDETGMIVAVNEAWKRVAVDNHDAAIRRNGVGSNYFNECDNAVKRGYLPAETTLAGMKAVISAERSSYYEEYDCSSPAGKRWFSMRVLRFDSNDAMIVVSHEDITFRKTAEQDLISKNAELVKINAELDRFAYSVSHDLRSPLSSVLGLVSLIDMESQEPQTLQASRMIRQSITRLDELLRNILNYSRNNRADLEISPFSVLQEINDCANSFAPRLAEHGISFLISVTQEPDFFSDRKRFRVIMENLIENAIKFHSSDTRDKFIKISGLVERERLLLEIEDNGIGIPAEYHDKIFDMFFRLPHKRAGSGIGLYIVKETLSKMQGSVSIRSTEGVGTTFFIQILNFSD